jgi:DNA-binding CsgD family transcriptional regulator
VDRCRKTDSCRAFDRRPTFRPQRFVFFDRRTGTRRFEVEASKDGSLPVDQAASLLAIQCVAWQQDPRDFRVMVALHEDLVEGLLGRARQLIHSCADARLPVPLSRRQHEVLTAVAQNLSNKEIAGRLNVSVRTVKFHVSALLEKFDVHGRLELMQEAVDLFSRDAMDRVSRKTAQAEKDTLLQNESPSPAAASCTKSKGPVLLDPRFLGTRVASH